MCTEECYKLYRKQATEKTRLIMCLECRGQCKENKQCTVLKGGKVGIKEQRKQPKVLSKLFKAKKKERTQCSRDSTLFIIFQCNHNDGIIISN